MAKAKNASLTPKETYCVGQNAIQHNRTVHAPKTELERKLERCRLTAEATTAGCATKDGKSSAVKNKSKAKTPAEKKQEALEQHKRQVESLLAAQRQKVEASMQPEVTPPAAPALVDVAKTVSMTGNSTYAKTPMCTPSIYSRHAAPSQPCVEDARAVPSSAQPKPMDETMVDVATSEQALVPWT